MIFLDISKHSHWLSCFVHGTFDRYHRACDEALIVVQNVKSVQRRPGIRDWRLTHREKGSRCGLVIIEIGVPGEVDATNLLGSTTTSFSFCIASIGHVGMVLCWSSWAVGGGGKKGLE